jgi:hypothetical protein
LPNQGRGFSGTGFGHPFGQCAPQIRHAFPVISPFHGPIFVRPSFGHFPTGTVVVLGGGQSRLIARTVPVLGFVPRSFVPAQQLLVPRVVVPGFAPPSFAPVQTRFLMD